MGGLVAILDWEIIINMGVSRRGGHTLVPSRHERLYYESRCTMAFDVRYCKGEKPLQALPKQKGQRDALFLTLIL